MELKPYAKRDKFVQCNFLNEKLLFPRHCLGTIYKAGTKQTKVFPHITNTHWRKTEMRKITGQLFNTMESATQKMKNKGDE